MIVVLLAGLFFGVGFFYVAQVWVRDLYFYASSNWDWSKDSGTPNAWRRVGSEKVILPKKQSVFFVAPIMMAVFGFGLLVCANEFLKLNI